MNRILIADTLPETVLQKYQETGEAEIDNRAGISKEELMEILPYYTGLVVRSRTKVTAEVLEHATGLKVIGRAGAGVDNIDTKTATLRGIIVMNTPGGNTIAATEHTIAMMLTALRNIPQAYISMQKQVWDRKSYMGKEIYEKTIGIVGLGKIGREVAKRLTSFKAKLLGYDPLLTSELAERLGVELVNFDELLQRSDIITIHAPKMAETLNMLNTEKLALCKDGVVIVNCARGGLVNEKDLLSALNSRKVSAAAFDVFENEPPSDWSLMQHPHFIGTPHLGASTEEAQTKVADQILEQMIEYFNHNVARNAVNFVSVEESVQPVIAPYFSLANQLGLLASQIRTGRMQEVAVRFYGDILKLPVEPIASHLMAGALKAISADTRVHDVDLINPVNSLAIAREKGIAVEISKKDQPLTSHTNLIACDFRTEQEFIHLAGTVYAKGLNRLIEFDEFIVDADLVGKMIIIYNKDVPGIIGKVGTLLGENKINISHLSSGRKKDKKLALNIFNVEGEWQPDLREKLQSIPQVEKVLLVDVQA